MPGYVVEVYLPRHQGAALDDVAIRLRQGSEGLPVVYVRSVFLPEDETCFHFFEAPSLAAIEESCHRLGLVRTRITRAAGVE